MIDKRRSLWSILFVALIITLSVPAVFPGLRLHYLAPVIVYSIYKLPLVRALWNALLLGAFMDLLSTQQAFTVHVPSYLFATLVLHQWRQQFFEDSAVTLGVMSALFGCIATLLQGSIFAGLYATLHWSWLAVLTDTALMSLLDGAYAFVVFTLPSLLKTSTPITADSSRPR